MKRAFFNRWFIAGLLLYAVAYSGCNKHLAPASYAFEEKQIKGSAPVDAHLQAIIQPYKDSLDKEMNVPLGFADTTLTKNQPESDLGNFMCDLILKKAREYYGKPIDFTFLNHGGIRLPSLAQGPITLGKMIELMPFDNRIVVMQLSGATVDSLFNHMASKGGWHISGARYKIKDGKAMDIEIEGAPLNKAGSYTVVVSDYLAGGGDNCIMLKGKPYADLRKILREVLIEGVKDMNKRGEHIKSVLDGRIQAIN